MLCDEHGARMPGARCRAIANGKLINPDTPNADGDGWLLLCVRHKLDTILLEWAPESTPDDVRYPFRLRYYVNLTTDSHTALQRRLSNLGYGSGATLRDNVESFQRQYGLTPATGKIEDIEALLYDYHDLAMLPVVPANEPPPHPAAPSPPPPPAPTEGRVKLGGGTPPGQGTARSDMVGRSLRLLDFNREPAADVACEIQLPGWVYQTTTDPAGVARFRAPRTMKICAVSWELAEASCRRQDVEILAHQEPDTYTRLGNLGYNHPLPDDRVASYQQSRGQEVTSRVDDVAQEVRGWHDGDPKPDSSQPLTHQNSVGFAPTEAQTSETKDSLSTAAPGAVAWGVDPFITLFPPLYFKDGRLRAALEDRFTKAAPQAALSVVELAGTARPHFGYRDKEEHFSGSTCKFTAMACACLLLRSLRNYAVKVGDGVPLNQLLNKAAIAFRKPILDAAMSHPKLKLDINEPTNQGLVSQLLPKLNRGFVAVANPNPEASPHPHHWVEFRPQMSGAIRLMIRESSTYGSTITIQNVGFGYIHGAMKHGFLFEREDSDLNGTGLWLAGDYSGLYSARRIEAVNEPIGHGTAQGATTLTFLKLLDMVISGEVGSRDFQVEQLKASRIHNYSWIFFAGANSRDWKGFHDEMGKFGVESVNTGKKKEPHLMVAHQVYSEILVVLHRATDRRFLVGYQSAYERQLRNIGEAILDGLHEFIYG